MAQISHRSFILIILAGAVAIIISMSLERGRLQDQVRKLQNEVISLQNLKQPRISAMSSSSPHNAGAIIQTPPPNNIDALSSSSQEPDPSRRATRFNEAILRIEAKYGRLFSRLKDWSPERREALKRLMAENELRSIESMQSEAPLTPTGVQNRFDALARARTENVLQLREMMGEQDYAKLDNFEQERSSMESVSAITNAMRSNGADVSGDLEDAILKSYAAALQEAAQQASKVDPHSLTPEQQVELNQQQHHAFQIILLKQMSGLLEGKQLDALMAAVIEQQESASP